MDYVKAGVCGIRLCAMLTAPFCPPSDVAGSKGCRWTICRGKTGRTIWAPFWRGAMQLRRRSRRRRATPARRMAMRQRDRTSSWSDTRERPRRRRNCARYHHRHSSAAGVSFHRWMRLLTLMHLPSGPPPPRRPPLRREGSVGLLAYAPLTSRTTAGGCQGSAEGVAHQQKGQ